MSETPKPRVRAYFQAQVWQNDYAVDVDGAREFDATAATLAQPLDALQNLDDASYEADQIAVDSGIEHDGPFYVRVVDGFDWFLLANGIDSRADLTHERLGRLREEYGVNPDENPIRYDWLVKVIYVDLTDVPPVRSVVETRTMKLTDVEAAKLKKKAKMIFREIADGNDCYDSIVMTKIGSAPSWSVKEFNDWLAQYKIIEGDRNG